MMNQAACFPVTPSSEGPVLNQITKVRLADGREVGIVDWSWRPLYSTIDTLSGWTDSELRGFSYSLGQKITTSANLPAADRADATERFTNLKSAGELDALEEMLVYAICIEVYQLTDQSSAPPAIGGAGQPAATPMNVAVLHERCIFQLEVSQKDYQMASVGWFPSGFGVAVGGTDDTNDILYANNGAPSRDALDMMPVPTHIGGTEKFAGILMNPDGTAVNYFTQAGQAAATAVMRLRVNLMGLHKRPTG